MALCHFPSADHAFNSDSIDLEPRIPIVLDGCCLARCHVCTHRSPLAGSRVLPLRDALLPLLCPITYRFICSAFYVIHPVCFVHFSIPLGASSLSIVLLLGRPNKWLLSVQAAFGPNLSPAAGYFVCWVRIYKDRTLGNLSFFLFAQIQCLPRLLLITWNDFQYS